MHQGDALLLPASGCVRASMHERPIQTARQPMRGIWWQRLRAEKAANPAHDSESSKKARHLSQQQPKPFPESWKAKAAGNFPSESFRLMPKRFTSPIE